MRTVLLLLAILLATGGAGWLRLRTEEAEADFEASPLDDAIGLARPEGPRLRSARSPEARRGAGGSCVLAGRVLRDGAPCRARVALLRRPEDPLTLLEAPRDELHAGDDGAFRFTTAPKGWVGVRAVTPDGSRGSRSVYVRTTGAFVEIPVRSGACVLSGRAVREDGSPWRGRVAVKHAVDRVAGYLAEEYVSTDADGRFRFEHLPEGPARLVAVQAGAWRLTAAEVRLPYRAEYVLRVDEGRVERSGEVVEIPGGAPVPGASLVADSCRDDGVRLEVRATSGPRGTFRLALLPGSTTVVVKAAGHLPVERRVSVVEPSLRLELIRPGRIVGRVLDEAGHPIDGAVVQLNEARTTRSDGGGRYAFHGLAPGGWRPRVLGGGWHSQALEPGRHLVAVQVPPGEEVERDLEVVRGVLLQGRVVDADGEPVAGARVRVHYRWGSASGLEVPWTRTGADGRYHLDDVVPGRERQVRAEGPRAFEARSHLFEVKAGQVNEMDLRFPPPRSLVVRVVEPDGKTPVGGAWVKVDTEGDLYEFYLSRTTDADGRAEFERLPIGALAVRVDARGHVEAGARVAGAEHGRVERTISLADGSEIRGRVLFPDRTPAGGMCVHASQGPAHDTTYTDDDGSFTLRQLGPGTWELRAVVNGPWYCDPRSEPPDAVASAGDREVEIEVADRLSRPLDLTVLDPAGHLVQGFEARSECGRHERWTGSEGRLSLDVGHGVTWLEIHSPRDVLGKALPYAPIPVGPLRGDERRLTVQFEPGLSITGRVTDPQADPVPNARVHAFPHPPRGLPAGSFRGTHASFTTGKDGTFSLEGLHAGEYRLHVRSPAGYGDVPWLTVTAGTSDVSIVLGKGAKAMIRVLDPAGRAVEGAGVRYRRLGGARSGRQETNENGEASLSSLEARGLYEVSITPPSGRPDLGSLQIPEWTPSFDEFLLPARSYVRGIVVDGAGRPCHRASLVLRDASGRTVQQAESSRDGRFTLGRLAGGPYDLLALRPVGRSYVTASLHVRAGDESVRIVLERGAPLVVRFHNGPRAAIGRWVTLESTRDACCRRVAQVESDLTASFQVDPTHGWRFVLSLPTEGLVAFQGNVRGDAGRVDAAFVPSLTIRGYALWPPDGALPRVTVTAPGFRKTTTVRRDGTFSFEGLPPYRFTVSAQCDSPAGRHEARAEVEAGDSVQLVLR